MWPFWTRSFTPGNNFLKRTKAEHSGCSTALGIDPAASVTRLPLFPLKMVNRSVVLRNFSRALCLILISAKSGDVRSVCFNCPMDLFWYPMMAATKSGGYLTKDNLADLHGR